MTENNNKSKNNIKDLKDIIILIVATFGLFTTSVTFILNLQQWGQDPQKLRIVSVVGFCFFLFGCLWSAFKINWNNQKWLSASLIVLYIFSCPYFIWVGTWIIKPAPKPIIIDAMDSISLWTTYLDNKGSSLSINSIQGKTTNAMKISYDVKKDGYVGVTREISSEILTGTKSLGFSYKGDGTPNTIELKLIYKPDNNGESAVFSVLWDHATDMQNWTLREAPYCNFVCWRATGCQPGEALDPSKVWKIDFAISNKQTDTPGSGKVQIDDIQGYR